MSQLSTEDLLLKTPSSFSREESQPFANVMQRIYDHFHKQPEDIEILKADLQALPGAALLTGQASEKDQAGITGLHSIRDFIEECGKARPAEAALLNEALDKALEAYRKSLLGEDPRDIHFRRR